MADRRQNEDSANVQKFGRVEGVPEGEPCFVLRAKDEAAVAAILDYIRECQRLGSPHSHIAACRSVAGRFMVWQAEHPELCKVPD